MSNKNETSSEIDRRQVLKRISAAGAGITFGSSFMGSAAAAVGDVLAEVDLPGHTEGVGIAFDGTYTYTLGGVPLGAISCRCTIPLQEPVARRW